MGPSDLSFTILWIKTYRRNLHIFFKIKKCVIQCWDYLASYKSNIWGLWSAPGQHPCCHYQLFSSKIFLTDWDIIFSPLVKFLQQRHIENFYYGKFSITENLSYRLIGIMKHLTANGIGNPRLIQSYIYSFII